MRSSIPVLLACASCADTSSSALGVYEKLALDARFTAEGVALGDIDADGALDVIAGPWWFEGPAFAERHELRAPAFFDVESTSDAFFTWTYDVDADGHLDALVVGHPGTAGRWYRNPGDPASTRWTEHAVIPEVDGESPAFTDVTGDGVPELVHFAGGRLGFSTPVPSGTWPFTPVTPDLGVQEYTHGLGAGDVNGDGRVDLLERTGWWEQPEGGVVPWIRHEHVWSAEGGAQMEVFDVDGDGDPDVITSLAAHGWGVAWFEQTSANAWTRHLLTDDTGATAEPYGARFSQPHALAVADLDEDGVLDVITGKRRFAHGSMMDPEPRAAPVVYAFLTRRGANGVSFDARLLDDTSGVGTQIVAADADGDGDSDVILANKLGVAVLRAQR